MKEQKHQESAEHYAQVIPCSIEQVKQMEKVRDAFAHLDKTLIEELPHSAEQEQSRNGLKVSCSDAMSAIMDHWEPAPDELPEADAGVEAESEGS